MYQNNTKTILIPIIVAVSIVVGLFAYPLLSKKGAVTTTYRTVGQSKLDMVMGLINEAYVDTVNTNKLEEDAIQNILKDLDPHTVYIPVKDVARVNEEMNGNFGGIGVQFYKYLDTVTVVNVVKNSPSQEAGIIAGDRIVTVDGVSIVGKMSTDSIMLKLRGEIGSKVKLGVYRRSLGKDLMEKTVTRGTIPVSSIGVAYMINDTTGLINVKQFGMNTYNEFMSAMQKLSAQGMKNLIIDLESNPGGILPIAINMINEFLPENRLIVYTQGKAVPKSEYRSNGKGQYQNIHVSVLINEESASASEIFAGAIQDNDCGTIIGRRSFGKGLVQEQRTLNDGSLLRLTIARYYVPSGRCIQRPYDKGREQYYEDIVNRYTHGEFTQKDSIHFKDTTVYKTVGGRAVYGGGGIMPDVFVPLDTTLWTPYYGAVNGRFKGHQILYEYTFKFMDQHRAETKDIKDYKELLKYLSKFDLVGEMVAYAEKIGLKPNYTEINHSRAMLLNNIEAFIGRHVLDDDGFYPIFYRQNEMVQKALVSYK